MGAGAFTGTDPTPWRNRFFSKRHFQKSEKIRFGGLFHRTWNVWTVGQVEEKNFRFKQKTVRWGRGANRKGLACEREQMPFSMKSFKTRLWKSSALDITNGKRPKGLKYLKDKSQIASG